MLKFTILLLLMHFCFVIDGAFTISSYSTPQQYVNMRFEDDTPTTVNEQKILKNFGVANPSIPPNHGTITKAEGKFGGAICFKQMTKAVDTGFELKNDFTISGWFKLDDDPQSEFQNVGTHPVEFQYKELLVSAFGNPFNNENSLQVFVEIFDVKLQLTATYIFFNNGNAYAELIEIEIPTQNINSWNFFILKVLISQNNQPVIELTLNDDTQQMLFSGVQLLQFNSATVTIGGLAENLSVKKRAVGCYYNCGYGTPINYISSVVTSNTFNGCIDEFRVIDQFATNEEQENLQVRNSQTPTRPIVQIISAFSTEINATPRQTSNFVSVPQLGKRSIRNTAQTFLVSGDNPVVAGVAVNFIPAEVSSFTYTIDGITNDVIRNSPISFDATNSIKFTLILSSSVSQSTILLLQLDANDVEVPVGTSPTELLFFNPTPCSSCNNIETTNNPTNKKLFDKVKVVSLNQLGGYVPVPGAIVSIVAQSNSGFEVVSGTSNVDGEAITAPLYLRDVVTDAQVLLNLQSITSPGVGFVVSDTTEKRDSQATRTCHSANDCPSTVALDCNMLEASREVVNLNCAQSSQCTCCNCCTDSPNPTGAFRLNSHNKELTFIINRRSLLQHIEVFEDINHNNVRDSGEPDLSGVEITIFQQGRPPIILTTKSNGKTNSAFLETTHLSAWKFSITNDAGFTGRTLNAPQNDRLINNALPSTIFSSFTTQAFKTGVLQVGLSNPVFGPQTILGPLDFYIDTNGNNEKDATEQTASVSVSVLVTEPATGTFTWRPQEIVARIDPATSYTFILSIPLTQLFWFRDAPETSPRTLSITRNVATTNAASITETRAIVVPSSIKVNIFVDSNSNQQLEGFEGVVWPGVSISFVDELDSVLLESGSTLPVVYEFLENGISAKKSLKPVAPEFAKFSGFSDGTGIFPTRSELQDIVVLNGKQVELNLGLYCIDGYKFKIVDEIGLCVPCADGFYSIWLSPLPTSTAIVIPTEGDCVSCPEGWKGSKEHDDCTNCEAGTQVSETLLSCDACDTGKFRVQDSSEKACIPCDCSAETLPCEDSDCSATIGCVIKDRVCTGKPAECNKFVCNTISDTCEEELDTEGTCQITSDCFAAICVADGTKGKCALDKTNLKKGAPKSCCTNNIPCAYESCRTKPECIDNKCTSMQDCTATEECKSQLCVPRLGQDLHTCEDVVDIACQKKEAAENEIGVTTGEEVNEEEEQNEVQENEANEANEAINEAIERQINAATSAREAGGIVRVPVTPNNVKEFLAEVPFGPGAKVLKQVVSQVQPNSLLLFGSEVGMITGSNWSATDLTVESADLTAVGQNTDGTVNVAGGGSKDLISGVISITSSNTDGVLQFELLISTCMPKAQYERWTTTESDLVKGAFNNNNEPFQEIAQAVTELEGGTTTEENGQVCTTVVLESDHLTNFAVLLDGGGSGGSSGNGAFEGTTVQWLSLSFGLAALLLVAFVITVSYAKGKYTTHQKESIQRKKLSKVRETMSK